MRAAIIAVVSSVFVLCSSAHGAMEHNAFLDRPVFSVRRLVDQIGNDPVVLKRYERHFHRSRAELTRLFESLHIEPLKSAERFTVYSIDRGYVVRKRRIWCRRGELVFADRKHRAILKRSCGNPLVGAMPPGGVVEAAVHIKPGRETLSLGGGAAQTPAGTEQPRSTLDEPLTISLESLSLEPTALALPDPGNFAPSPDAVTSLSDLGSTSSVDDSSLPAVVIGAGVIAWASNTDFAGPRPVPEPATLLVLGVGAGLLAKRRRLRP